MAAATPSTGSTNLNPDKVDGRPRTTTSRSPATTASRSQHWNGVDLTVNARLARGMTLQGGVSTGQRETDNCDVIATLPEAALLTAPYCHQKDNFLTDGKLIATYTIPKIDVTVSGLFFSRPGPATRRQQGLSRMPRSRRHSGAICSAATRRTSP